MHKKLALVSLLLLVPAPSIGAWFGLVLFPDAALGKVVFAGSKVWLFGLPVVWYLWVEKGRLGLSPARKGGFGVAVLSGLAISAAIFAAYLLFGPRLIDRVFLAEKLREVGLGVPGVYIAGAAYWILVNSVLEEYVWRWFVVKQCETLLPPAAAVLCSAVFFTLHHVVAMQSFLGAGAVALCAAGVFIGGAFWSLMYIRYRSIWPGYVSHAIVDLCIFGIGAWMLFG